MVQNTFPLFKVMLQRRTDVKFPPDTSGADSLTWLHSHDLGAAAASCSRNHLDLPDEPPVDGVGAVADAVTAFSGRRCGKEPRR